MSIRLDDIRRGVVGRCVTRLLLLAVLLRVLVPVGFMPDFDAASSGSFRIVICTSYGTKMVTLDDQGNPVPGQESGSHHDQPCAFTGLATVTLPALDTQPFTAPETYAAPYLPRLAVDLPPVRAGPQLGSRGPPVLS